MADANKTTAPALDMATVQAVPMAVATAVDALPSSPQQVHIHISTPTAARPGWTSGVFGCTDNCCTCWMGLCCPCVLYGQIAERVGHNGCCAECGCCCSGLLYGGLMMLGALPICVLTCLLRGKVGSATGIQSNGCDDACMALCCGPCTLCQMANQVEIQKDGCSFSAPPRMETMQR